jgi:copper chaperone
MRDYISGVNTYNVDLGTQKVDVTGTISYDDLLAKIKKTGKEVSTKRYLP